jgi:hypothetical protein
MSISRVLELSSEGDSQREIASKLQIGKETVTNDLLCLKRQVQQNLQHHIHEVIPEEYQKGMTGMRQNPKRALEIGEASLDPKAKLESIRIANDCHRFIMDLCTNASIVSDALTYVTQKREAIDKLQKIDERIAAAQQQSEEEGVGKGEETTNHGVF